MNTGKENRINVIQGTHRVSRDPNDVLTAVLGSCVAVCAYDPALKIGGMNHILLPGKCDASVNSSAGMYAANLMELLLNDLFKMGAVKSTLEFKLFGGAQVLSSGANVGQGNIDFVLQFAHDEHLNVVSQSLGGTDGRRIEFRPTTGKLRQKFLKDVADSAPAMAPKPETNNTGDLELF